MNPAERVCGECGEELRPGASFCRNCGARYVEPEPEPEPEAEPEPQPEAEPEPEPEPPTCPRCGAELASGAAFCRSCGTPVAAAEPPTVVASPAVPPPREPEPVPPPAAPPPSSGGRSRGRVALIVGALLVVVGAGVAIALLVGGSSGSHTVTTTVDLGTSPRLAASEEEAGGEAEAEEAPVESLEEPDEVEEEEATAAAQAAEESELEEEEAAAEEVSSSGYPEVPRAAMNQEVAAVLKRYHEDVVDEDFQGAWATLTRRKRRQDLREYGYHKWASAQSSLSPYLDPYGLEAQIVALEGEGVARVEVTGMGWNAPGASCSEWSGLTWVKYEGGAWAYDPGYSTTAARRAEWRSKSDRLLGGDC